MLLPLLLLETLLSLPFFFLVSLVWFFSPNLFLTNYWSVIFFIKPITELFTQCTEEVFHSRWLTFFSFILSSPLVFVHAELMSNSRCSLLLLTPETPHSVPAGITFPWLPVVLGIIDRCLRRSRPPLQLSLDFKKTIKKLMEELRGYLKVTALFVSET